jgi:hypothetical protein
VKLNKLTNLLLSQLQDEQSVQSRLETLLKAQTQAAIAGDTDVIEATSQKVEVELSEEPMRDKRRKALMSAFGGELGVPPQLLTIGSLIERLAVRGIPTAGLSRVRNELKDSLLAVRKQARKLAVIARGHGEVLRDVMCLLGGTGEKSPSTGILIDAEI